MLLDDPRSFTGPVAVLLSGGNIDPLLLTKVIRHGLIADSRYLVLRIVLPDQPGALAGLTALVAESGANVVHVSHGRADPSLTLGDVEVLLQLETRGRAHASALMDLLAQSGYRVEATK